MKDRDSVSLFVPGGSALLVIFSVLCLTVFSLLTYSTARADARLNEASVRAVTMYYEADLQAEKILAQLRGGQFPECVTYTNDICSYSCPITDTQHLQVQVRNADGKWEILQWQAISTIEYRENEWSVWDGE